MGGWTSTSPEKPERGSPEEPPLSQPRKEGALSISPASADTPERAGRTPKTQRAVTGPPQARRIVRSSKRSYPDNLPATPNVAPTDKPETDLTRGEGIRGGLRRPARKQTPRQRIVDRGTFPSRRRAQLPQSGATLAGSAAVASAM